MKRSVGRMGGASGVGCTMQRTPRALRYKESTLVVQGFASCCTVRRLCSGGEAQHGMPPLLSALQFTADLDGCFAPAYACVAVAFGWTLLSLLAFAQASSRHISGGAYQKHP